jgi:hypothetical protein
MVTRVGAVPWFGSAAAVGPARPLLDVAGIFANPGGPGCWPMGRDGGVFAHGGAPFLGSAPATVTVGDILDGTAD